MNLEEYMQHRKFRLKDIACMTGTLRQLLVKYKNKRIRPHLEVALIIQERTNKGVALETLGWEKKGNLYFKIIPWTKKEIANSLKSDGEKIHDTIRTHSLDSTTPMRETLL